jgi:hypothetical protein
MFFSIPIPAAMAMAIPSMLTAVANNMILLTTVGMKTIGLVEKITTRSLGPENQSRDAVRSH